MKTTSLFLYLLIGVAAVGCRYANQPTTRQTPARKPNANRW
ncbi:hypothetical protein [Nibrella viscosa]